MKAITGQHRIDAPAMVEVSSRSAFLAEEHNRGEKTGWKFAQYPIGRSRAALRLLTCCGSEP